jgi:hypothetical protein
VTHWPPWKARNAAEQQEMIGAVVAELLIEDEHAETLIMRWDGTMATEAAFRAALYTAKASARRGNLEPLRRLLSDLDPELAEFINAPPRVRGQRRPDCGAGSRGGPQCGGFQASARCRARARDLAAGIPWSLEAACRRRAQRGRDRGRLPRDPRRLAT